MNMNDYNHMASALDERTFPELLQDIQTAAEYPDGVILINGADLKPEPIRWLWPGWLASGKMHLLAGSPGQGKTTLALSMAATVTNGGRWPDGSHCAIGNVLIWSGEDDPADTLLPRLLAAGAAPERCFFVSDIRINGEVRPFDPAADMDALTAKAESIGEVKLLIIDPIVSMVKGDGNKNPEVRRGLQPLVNLCSQLGAAALGITHFSKGGHGLLPVSQTPC